MSAAFNSLPDEVIKNYILPHFSLFIPDESTLILRAVCKRLCSMVPADAVAFRKRAKWLMDGKPEEWDKEKNSYEMKCDWDLKRIWHVSYTNMYFRPPPLFRHGWFTFAPTEDRVVKFTVDDDNETIRMSYQIFEMEDEERCNKERSEINIQVSHRASCKFGEEVFFILADGTLLRTCVTSSLQETNQLFQTLTSGPQKKLSLPVSWTLFRFRSMQTSDGEHFLIKDVDGDLFILNWSFPDKLETIAKSVRYFQLFDDIVVFLTFEGNLKLLRLKFKDQVTEYSTVNLETEMAQHFVAVPSEQHLWIISVTKQVIKYSMPSL
jgi:hypothetical protein